MAYKKKSPVRKATKRPVKKKAKKKYYTKPRKKKDDCYITTACVEYYSLPDNCKQLETLRSFRDSYLKNSEKGKQLVQTYYSVAPTLVKQLKKDPSHTSLFELIFEKINSACEQIELKNYSNAKIIYINIVSFLINRYK